jgi:hypothetical protein
MMSKANRLLRALSCSGVINPSPSFIPIVNAQPLVASRQSSIDNHHRQSTITRSSLPIANRQSSIDNHPFPVANRQSPIT